MISELVSPANMSPGRAVLAVLSSAAEAAAGVVGTGRQARQALLATAYAEAEGRRRWHKRRSEGATVAVGLGEEYARCRRRVGRTVLPELRLVQSGCEPGHCWPIQASRAGGTAIEQN